MDQVLVNLQRVLRLLGLEIERGEVLLVGLVLRFKYCQQGAGFNCLVNVGHVAVDQTREFDGFQVIRVFGQSFTNEITGGLVFLVFKGVTGCLEIVGFSGKA